MKKQTTIDIPDQNSKSYYIIKKWDGNPTSVQVFGHVIKNLDGSGFSHPNFLDSSSFYHPTFLTVVF